MGTTPIWASCQVNITWLPIWNRQKWHSASTLIFTSSASLQKSQAPKITDPRIMTTWDGNPLQNNSLITCTRFHLIASDSHVSKILPTCATYTSFLELWKSVEKQMEEQSYVCGYFRESCFKKKQLGLWHLFITPQLEQPFLKQTSLRHYCLAVRACKVYMRTLRVVSLHQREYWRSHLTQSNLVCQVPVKRKVAVKHNPNFRIYVQQLNFLVHAHQSWLLTFRELRLYKHLYSLLPFMPACKENWVLLITGIRPTSKKLPCQSATYFAWVTIPSEHCHTF